MDLTISLPRFARRIRFACSLRSAGVLICHESFPCTPRRQGHRHNPRQGGSPLRWQDGDVQRPGELRAVHRRIGWAYQRVRPAIPLQDPAAGTAGLTRRQGRAALRGISRALALQQGYMPAQIAGRYTRLAAPDRAAQDTGEGATAILGIEHVV
jgi:hypothetical protein